MPRECTCYIPKYSALIPSPAELYACQYALPFSQMYTFTMFRCDVVVFGDGADDDLALPRLRANFGPQGSDCRRVGLLLSLYNQSLMPFLRYVDEILKTSSEDVEDVIVEADGEWHTSDNKYGSTGWKAAHPPAAPKIASPRKFVPAKSPASKGPNGDPNGKRKAAEIVVLDSDDEDEGRVKRELSPSFASTSSANRSYGSVPGEASQSAVIDLTLDSDDDEAPVRPFAKRTASEAGIASPTEQIWKKGRTDTPTIPRPPPKPTVTLNSTDYGRAPGLSTSPRLALPPVPAYAPPAGYSGPVLPPVYSMNRGTTTSTQTVQLPPPNQFVNRVNRW